MVEPRVRVLAEFVWHGYVHPDGRPSFGEPCVQVCSDEGVWIETRSESGELRSDERERLREEVERVANALSRAHYFGPFGIDAYRWRGAKGEHFQARNEINARYTMGWPVGVGAF